MYLNVKKVFVFTCMIGLLLCTSCGNETNSNGYAIEATINGIPDGVRAFLKVPNEKGVPQPKDTAIVQNGKFVFTGEVEFPQLGFIYVNGAPGSINLFIENANVTIDAHKDSLPTANVIGGKHNKEYKEFLKTSRILGDKVRRVRKNYQAAVVSKDTALINAARKNVNNTEKEAAAFQQKYVAEHPESYISTMLVSNLLRTKVTSAQKAKKFYDALPDEMKKTNIAQDLHIKTTELLRSAIGSVATNFSAPNPEGKTISLNDIKGKVTIIDFWAAWCKPCRMENPNVVKIYEKYHKDGLEIIGVSLDGRPNQNNAKEQWLRAIETDGLTWPQVSNLDGFKDAIARMYNVRSIPATFILNEKGEIAAKNLRGATLEAKVKELLGK